MREGSHQRYLSLMVIVLVFAVFAGCIGTETGASPQKALEIEQIKSSSMSISYDELMRNNENYIGQLLFYRGKVTQIIEGTENYGDDESMMSFSINKIVQAISENENEYILLIATKADPYAGYSDEIIWIKYKGKRMQENDIVDVWGRFEGLKTPYTVFSNELTLPGIDSLHLELVEKAGER